MLNIPQVGSSNGTDNLHQQGIDPKRTHNWDDGSLGLTEISLCEWRMFFEQVAFFFLFVITKKNYKKKKGQPIS